MSERQKQDRKIRALLAKLEPEIQSAFLKAMAQGSIAIDRGALIRLIDAGDVASAAELLKIDRGILYPIENVIQNAFIAGGQLAASAAPKALAGSFGFNGSHPRAIELARNQAAEFVTSIDQQMKANARSIITQGLSENRSPRKIATDLVGRQVGKRRVGGTIGLTEQLTDSIINGRANLQSGDPDRMRRYLKLKLRNRTHDKKIRAAIEAKRPISGALLDTIIEDHRSKALGYRGRVVAKNEAFTAQAIGQSEAYDQMAENPKVQEVTVRWQHNLSENARPDHQDMDGTIIKKGESFVFPDNVRMKHPHDPAGGPKHSVGCRCTAFYRVILRRRR